MAINIDTLQIQIETTSNDAANKINALTKALTNLKAVTKGGAGLNTSKTVTGASTATNGATSASKK